MAVLMTQLLAIVVTILLRQQDFLSRLGAVSLYLQWTVLLSVAILCLLRDKLNRASGLIAISGATLCFFVPFVMTEVFSHYLEGRFSLAVFDWQRFLSFSAVALILTLFVLRLFAITALIEQRNRAEMEMRMQALQSRIRPHFLFNSLNTIAELTATEPRQAEQAIDSLSQLFRAGLESNKRFHSLANELNLCKRYVELERWRLDQRLSIQWSTEIAEPEFHQVPRLILQPLIENAIVHGVRDDGQIVVKIDLRETKRDLSLVIENSRGSAAPFNDGHGIAVDNIRERLFVLYDDQQTFRVRETSDSYSVLMRFPKQTLNQVNGA